MRREKGMLALFLSIVLLVTGCGASSGQSVPELREPVSRNSAYRPVERGRIGEVKVLRATVMPTEYGSFYSSDAAIEKITVEVGDYVKKGDIVACADVREARARKKQWEEQLVQEQKKFSLQEKISEQKKLELKLSGEKNADPLTVLEEEERYEKHLYEQAVKKIQAQIQEEESRIREGTLRARHDGYVVYRKNLSVSTTAEPCENVVVVADKKHPYLEMEACNTKQYLYQGYEVKYILSGGKQYSVDEIPYLESELALAKKLETYPAVRFTCPKKAKFSIGESCLVYFREKDVSDVLVVGNDSLHTQGEGYYVYVKTDTGDEEKRDVIIGEQDAFRTEIRDGLEEGEMIRYSANSALPADYAAYTVESGEYEIKSRTGVLHFADAVPDVSISELEGTIVKSVVEEGDTVKKGDLLYVVDTGKGKAALTELSYQIQKEKDSYTNARKEQRKEAAAQTRGKGGRLRQAVKKRLQYEAELAEYTHNCTLQELEREYQEAQKGNNGAGLVNVYAEQSGTLAACQIHVGETVSVGSQMFVTQTDDKSYLRIEQIPPLSEQPSVEKVAANVGEEIQLSLSGKTVCGICTGYVVGSNNVDRIWFYTEGGKSVLCKNTNSGYDYPGYYVELEDDSLYDQMTSETKVTYAYVHYKDVIMVPLACIHKEISGENVDASYVWRVVGEELVKQYVALDEEMNNGEVQVIFAGLNPGDVVAG